MLLSLTTGTWLSIFQKIRREQNTRSRSLLFLHSTSCAASVLALVMMLSPLITSSTKLTTSKGGHLN